MVRVDLSTCSLFSLSFWRHGIFPYSWWFYLGFFQDIAKTPLLRIVWARIILDEAHCVRNPRVQTSMAVCKLQAHARWAVTGTPIQNTLLDMYSLLKWVKTFRIMEIWTVSVTLHHYFLSQEKAPRVCQIISCSGWQASEPLKGKRIHVYEEVISWLVDTGLWSHRAPLYGKI